MSSKILLLSVAVIAVGLFAMPSTLSLFAGQHTFDAGSQVQCSKCHADIYDEMGGSGIYGSSSAHSSLTDCTGCHRTGDIVGTIPLNKTTLGDYIQDVGVKGAHAAVTMECTGCHSGVPAEITHANESHGPYFENASASGILKGSNEACVGCHTHTNINATWRWPVGMDLIIYNQLGNYTVNIVRDNGYNDTRTESIWVAADGQNP